MLGLPKPSSYVRSSIIWKCFDGLSVTGGMHIKPFIFFNPSVLQKSKKLFASSGNRPLFVGSFPVLIWIKKDLSSVFSGYFINSLKSFSLSRVWKTSNILSACLTLLDCKGPVKCSLMLVFVFFIFSNLDMASWTLFSPKVCKPQSIAFSTASFGWFLEIAIISAFLPKKSIFFFIFWYFSKLNIVFCCKFTTPYKKLLKLLCFFCTFFKFLINTIDNERKVFH